MEMKRKVVDGTSGSEGEGSYKYDAVIFEAYKYDADREREMMLLLAIPAYRWNHVEYSIVNSSIL
jgi:hypothetical protein